MKFNIEKEIENIIIVVIEFCGHLDIPTQNYGPFFKGQPWPYTYYTSIVLFKPMFTDLKKAPLCV